MWTKNGELFDINDPKYRGNDTSSRIVQIDRNTGTLEFIQFDEMDEGEYQCQASNSHGVSLSKKIQFVKASKKTFENPQGEPKKYEVKESDPLKLPCNPPKNDPPGIARWVMFQDDGLSKKYIDLSDRVAMDLDGRLLLACQFTTSQSVNLFTPQKLRNFHALTTLVGCIELPVSVAQRSCHV